MLDLATNFGVTLPGWEADLGACFLICKMQGLHLCDLYDYCQVCNDYLSGHFCLRTSTKLNKRSPILEAMLYKSGRVHTYVQFKLP